VSGRGKEEELDDFLDALDDVPGWFLELRRDVRSLDPEAARVLKDRLVAERGLSWCQNPVKLTLQAAFTWSGAPEGHKYWADLSARLWKKREASLNNHEENRNE